MTFVPTRSSSSATSARIRRVRRDHTDGLGVVTLSYDSRLRRIGLGREHARRRVMILIADLHIRVIDAETGELIRQLTLDPSKDYQPLGRPPGPPPPAPSSQPRRAQTGSGLAAGHPTGTGP